MSYYKLSLSIKFDSKIKGRKTDIFLSFFFSSHVKSVMSMLANRIVFMLCAGSLSSTRRNFYYDECEKDNESSYEHSVHNML